jgi:hypothetical protein
MAKVNNGIGGRQNLQKTTDGEGNNVTTNPIKVADLYIYDSANEVYVKITSDNNYGLNFLDETGHLIANITGGSYITKGINSEYTYQLVMDAYGGNRRAIYPGFDFVVNGTTPQHNYANDTLAGAGGIAIGQMYHTAGVVKIRLT